VRIVTEFYSEYSFIEVEEDEEEERVIIKPGFRKIYLEP